MKRKVQLEMEKEITKKVSLLHKFIHNVCLKTDIFIPHV